MAWFSFGKVSKDTFRDLVVAELARRSPGMTTEYDAEQFALVRDGHQGSRIFLANAYDAYVQAARGERRLVLERYVALTLVPPTATGDFAAIAPMLLPVVRSLAAMEEIAISMQLKTGAEPKPPQHEVGGFLSLSLAVDHPDRLEQLPEGAWDAWNMTFSASLDVALGNLRARGNPAWAMPYQGVFVSPWRDCYDPSRLLLPEFIERLNVRGQPVAIAATRSHLIVTGSEDESGLREALEVAREAQQQDRSLTLIPLRLTEDGWSEFHPETSFPSLEQYRSARIRERGGEYGRQQELLNARMSDQPGARFVASYKAYGKDGNIDMTIATWTEGVPSLLPLAEQIFLLQPEQNLICTLPFATAIAALPHRLKKTTHYPVRYETEGFPTAEEVTAMGGAFRPTQAK